MSVKIVTMRVLMDDTVLPIGDTCHAMMCRVRADGTLPIGEFQVLRVEPHSWMKTLEDTSQSTGEHTMYPVYKHTGEFDAVEEYFDRLIIEGCDYHPEDSTHSIDAFVKRFTMRERDILDAQMNLIIEVFGAERTCAAMLKRTKPAAYAAQWNSAA